jgi:hypothetical protein
MVSSSTVTGIPGVNGNGSDNGGSSGLSSKSKGIIGGVVGGIGGAILLGGIALVLFRVYGRKRYNENDDLDYHAGTGQGLSSSGAGDKSESAYGGLAADEAHSERYTQPVRPNAAANF